jgi:two-component system, NtrC family, sensor histidine kinase HydH
MPGKVKLIKNIIIQPKSIVLIFLVTAVIVIATAFIELSGSKKEMFSLMEKQSRSLLETLLASSSNALLSNEKIEDELKTRLLNNALLIKYLYENGLVTDKLIRDIARQNNLFRINIFNRNGKKIFTSSSETHHGINEKENPAKYLKPIFEDNEDTLIIGVKPARYLEGTRYAVAVAAKGRDAIVLNVDADELLKFRKQVGFGALLKEVAKSSNIEYVLLQDKNNIIAAAGDSLKISFLDSAKIPLNTNSDYSTAIVEKNGLSFFEARHLFVYDNESVGVFRIGLSLEPINSINSRITQRIIILSVFLFIFGSVSLALIFFRQNFALLSKKFYFYKEYSQSIIDNIGESIILLDSKNNIKSANNATSAIFNIDISTITGKPMSSAFDNSMCDNIINEKSLVLELSCSLGGKNKTLLISKSSFTDENGEANTILLIKDLTALKELEKQFERQERLAAMGELASSVAHEIRNPLNAISTIVQQLNKDFEPADNKEEYKSLTKLVYSEVNRINSTIENFLRFARPLEIKKEQFPVSSLFEQIKKQYTQILKEKNIILVINSNWNGEVVWDRSQILQALINIIENSIDSITGKGGITIALNEDNSSYISIAITDTGQGIDEKTIDKIFNLYFTTKQKGNGIGLSIVQKIITGHNGRIRVESHTNKGTAFLITLPKFA